MSLSITNNEPYSDPYSLMALGYYDVGSQQGIKIRLTLVIIKSHMTSDVHYEAVNREP